MICLWKVKSLPAVMVSQRNLQRWHEAHCSHFFLVPLDLHRNSNRACSRWKPVSNCFEFSIRMKHQWMSWRSLSSLHPRYFYLTLNPASYKVLYQPVQHTVGDCPRLTKCWQCAVIGKDWTVWRLKWKYICYREGQNQTGRLSCHTDWICCLLPSSACFCQNI